MSFKILRNNTFQLKNTLLQKSFFTKEEGPINLIEFRREKLVLNEDALKIIRDIKDNIIIVSIFGKERTGKSYLMNLLLNEEENSKITKGFKVSSIANSSTRGIWLWSTPVSKPNSKDKIIFIDSKGIYCENVYEQVSGSKLLALILIISSFFIYNTMGEINSNSLNDLELLIHLGDSIGINENINKDKLISEICPKFIWAMRDFNLKELSPKNEKRMTSDEYMEKCLQERFDGENKDEINLIKENFIKYFKQRECITLPKPVQEEKDLIMLKKKQVTDLENDFQKEFLRLKYKIYKLSKEKIINGKSLNGPMVAYIISQFVKEINNENIPHINIIFKEMILLDMDNSYNLAKNCYKEKIEKLKKEELNLDIKEIYSIKYEAIKEYIKILEKYPEITKQNTYLNEYNTRKEKLDKEIEKLISQELQVLMSNNSYKLLFNSKDKDKDNVNDKEYKKSSELIEDYLNELCELKLNSENAVLNDEDFESFITDDISKTKNIIDFMEKNYEIYVQKKESSLDEEKIKSKEVTNDVYNLQEYENLKEELKNTEKLSTKLITKFNKLMETRDKCKLRPSSNHLKHNLRTFSSKLVINSFNEENLCQLSSEEKRAEKCNCNLNSLKNCDIF